MEVFRDIYGWMPPGKGSSVALGRFDGVHLGHRAILDRAVEFARENELTSVCFSFREETYPGALERGIITTEEEKLDLLRKIGIDVVLHPAFEAPLIQTSHDMFLHSLLVNRWKAKMIVVGYDFRFGKDRLGDPEFLEKEAQKRGARIDVLRPVSAEGEVVKATLIRSLLRQGNVEKANKLLGRAYSITAPQVAGQRMGSKLGFPTLNFNWPDGKVPLRYGVYAVRVASYAFRDDPSDETKPVVDGVANFGLRPSVEKDRKQPILETHLLDPGKMIDMIADPPSPGMHFTIGFEAYIRPEQQFDDLLALKAQIAADVRSAREFLSHIE